MGRGGCRPPGALHSPGGLPEASPCPFLAATRLLRQRLGTGWAQASQVGSLITSSRLHPTGRGHGQGDLCAARGGAGLSRLLQGSLAPLKPWVGRGKPHKAGGAVPRGTVVGGCAEWPNPQPTNPSETSRETPGAASAFLPQQVLAAVAPSAFLGKMQGRSSPHGHGAEATRSPLRLQVTLDAAGDGEVSSQLEPP